MRNVVSFYFILCLSKFGMSQGLFGMGVNGGYKSSGPKIELYTLNRLRIESGLDWNRFNILSTYVGAKYSLLDDRDRINNFWLGTRVNNSYEGNLSISHENKFYDYKLNKLFYVVPSVSFARRFNANTTNSFTKFMLLDVNLNYRILSNDVDLKQSTDNLFQSNNVEEKLTKYFQSGFGFYVGVTFFLGKRESAR